MRLSGSTIFWTVLWCLFMGVTAISIGFGAIFPAINRISKPVVCPGGEMTLETQDYHPSPIETVTTLTWYCVDSETGEKTEISIFPMAFTAGLIYGALLAVIVLAVMWFQAGRSPVRVSFTSGFGSRARSTGMNAGAAARMKELKQMRDEGLINETEYLEKRSEILDDL